MEEIQKDFNELYPNVTIYYSADSSGTLQTQIEEGARCDLFFSAADKQMDALTEEKLTKEDTVKDLLENKVVLIKPKDGETISQTLRIWRLQERMFRWDSTPVRSLAILESWTM